LEVTLIVQKIGSSAKPAVPSDVTAEADDFMQRTFDLDYQARPSAAKLLEHPWVIYDPLLSFAAANAAITQTNSSAISS
jgi:mitogen-activated protein kinase kinase kinase